VTTYYRNAATNEAERNQVIAEVGRLAVASITG